MKRGLRRQAHAGADRRDEVVAAISHVVVTRDGLPEPVLQYEVYDEAGHFVARADAALTEHRVLIEYDSMPRPARRRNDCIVESYVMSRLRRAACRTRSMKSADRQTDASSNTVRSGRIVGRSSIKCTSLG